MRQMLISVQTSPAILLFLVSILLLAALFTLRVVTRRLQRFDQRLDALSNISEEQSRTLERLRRSLQETVIERSNAGWRRAPDLPPDAAEILRQELESLRSEMASDAPDGQPEQH